MPTTDPPSAPISYSVLPPKSRIVYEEDAQGVRITILPSGMWQVAKWPLLFCVIGSFLLLMLAVVGQFTLSHRLGVPVTIAGTVVGTLSWWKDAILDWELIVFLVFALAISFISGQEQVRLEANHQQLTTIIALWRWNWCKQWPTSTITSVRVGWASVNIYRGRWRPSARVGGLSKREGIWLAAALRHALGLFEEGQA